MGQDTAAVSEEFNRAVFFGKRFYSLGELASAYDQFTKADKILPDQPGVLYNLAVILFKLNRYSEAQIRIDRYMQLYPGGQELAQLSRLQFELDFQRELQKTRQATQDYMELFNRGKFLFAKGDVEGALRVLKEAEEKRPDDPAVVYNQALAHEVKGDFVRATERLRRYLELNQNAADKAAVDQKIFALEAELEDIRSKIVCPFCGHRLPIGSTWCHRCWHGPYLTGSGRWNSRPCGSGASTTRTLIYSDGRVNKNEDLACQLKEGNYLEALRYSPARQQSIQQARRGEGWTYEGEIIQSWTDPQGNQLKLQQGQDYLEKVLAMSSGDILEFTAHRGPGERWLLDREELIIDGVKYTKRYSFDPSGRIIQELVRYQNPSACNHMITMTADYVYENENLVSAKLRGEYDGYQVEGAPGARWDGTLTFSYDEHGRVQKEDFTVASHQKTYQQRPESKHREQISKLLPGMRVKRPTDLSKTGDLCGFHSGTAGNPIDLRPFYTLSPNLTVALPFGVTRLTVSHTYPEGFRIQ